MVFGIESPYHLQGNLVRKTDSMNYGVYEEDPLEIKLKPRIRYYKEKTTRSAIKDSSNEKIQTRQQMMQAHQEEMQKMKQLEENGRIDFSKLPVIEPRVREILLKWLSDAFEDADYTARTDDGRQYTLDRSMADQTCTVTCEDGKFTMPKLVIVFMEEEA